MSLKKDIISILLPIFGASIKQLIEEQYNDNNPKELFAMAQHMLTGYMGEANANKILTKIISQYKLKV